MTTQEPDTLDHLFGLVRKGVEFVKSLDDQFKDEQLDARGNGPDDPSYEGPQRRHREPGAAQTAADLQAERMAELFMLRSIVVKARLSAPQMGALSAKERALVRRLRLNANTGGTQ